MNYLTTEIIESYDRFNEDNRLKSPYGLLEEEHTRMLITQHIVINPSIILDIGGGTGHYSSWLAEIGHKVHFSDIVPNHVQIFKERYSNLKNIVSIGVEDARSLSYQNELADLIILNGPLYHLPDKSERYMVLREAKRVLKKGGVLLGFSISRFAGLDYALSSGEVFNDDYFQMVKDEILTGYRNNLSLRNKTFTQAYFHLLNEIETEFIESGFKVKCSLGVLGQAWNTPNLDVAIKDSTKRERLLQIADLMKEYPMHSPKMMTIGIND